MISEAKTHLDIILWEGFMEPPGVLVLIEREGERANTKKIKPGKMPLVQ